MKTTHLLLSILLVLLTASGCTSDELQEKPQTNEKGEYAVHFSGNMDMILTKANSTVAKGVKATISAYTKDADVTSKTAIVSKGYTVGSTAGTFEGDASYVMYLPKGDYDFYAVSTNSATAAPTFTNGVSSVLENGVDYIYAKTASQSVGNAEKNITLEFSRKAVQIYIDIKSDETSLKLTAWQSGNDAATITPPVATGCTMALTDGAITAATSVNTTGANMTKATVTNNATSTSYIMLPLTANGSASRELTVTFKVTVQIGGRTAEDKTYTATLTAPNITDNNSGYAFLSGKKYTYTATLKANKITFTGATVADWTTVNTTDDLNPTEPAS
nr:fimbrillin family protein [Parabacteroides goldsteinii]